MNASRYDIFYHSAWCLCIITLPWTISLNSLTIILLAIVWLAEGKWAVKWERLKNSWWVLPFVLFFGIHLLGLFYTKNLSAGWFELEKKLSFVVLPVLAASGKPLEESFFDFLKKCFVCSCAVLVIGSLLYTALHIDPSVPGSNFDVQTEAYFHEFNPTASPLWENFSYIQVGSWMDLHPGYVSLYVIFCLSILLEEISISLKLSWVSVGGIVLFTFFLTLLASRMAILSFIIILVYFIIHQVRKGTALMNVWSFGCILVAFLGLIWLNPVARFRTIQEPKTTGLVVHQDVTQWNSVNLRVLEWQASWSIIQKSWLTGVGTGDGQDALNQFYASFNSSTVNMDYNSHNQYLQTLIELGILGLVSLLTCYFLPVIRPGTTALHLSFILLFSLMCLTECLLARQKGIVFFTLFQSLFLNVRPTTVR